MTRLSLRRLTHLPSAALIGLLVVGIIAPGAFFAAQSPPRPVFGVVGDSIEAGRGDDILGDGIGYVPLLSAFLTTMVFGQPVETHNFGVPFATTRDIWHTQLPELLAVLQGRAPVVVMWGGGGNDLGAVATGPQAAACRQSQSCLGRFNGLLNEVEETIDRTIGELRQAVGPAGGILMRTQYNALLRHGCAPPEVVLLGTITLEGAPNTVLDRGLNTRIRAVAHKYGAAVVDLFLPFAAKADLFVADDCIHPSGLGHQAIAAIAAQTFQ